mgnify:CR=1 FL=1
MASVLSDEELIAEFTKRFIVPQYYTRDHIESRISDAGKELTEEQIDEFIELYKSEGHYDVDESLKYFIEEMELESCSWIAEY